MHLLPARIKTNNKRVDIRNEINFFYLSIFTIAILFLSAFALKLHQINSNVLGTKTENPINEVEVSKQINFWKEFTLQNPTYFEGWMELYNLTGNQTYLSIAKAVDPNR